MKVLLDTHALIWAISEPGQLSDPARELISDLRTEVLASVVSIWEMAIKSSLGKLGLPQNIAQWMPQTLQTLGITTLDINVHHAIRVARLPWHHRDPFDRLLIAQSQVEDVSIVSRDRLFNQYEVTLIPS